MASSSTAEPVQPDSADSVEASAAVTPPARQPSGVTGWFKLTFASLENRSFRFLWLGMLLSMGGFQMQMIARGILVYDLTGDQALTAVVAMGFAPSLLVVSLFGGVLGDRMERRTLIQIAQLANALAAGVVALMLIADVVVWWHLFIVSLVQGAMFSLQMPARQAAIPKLVGKERVGNAVALNAMAMSAMNVAAPGIGGVIYGAWGPEVTYLVVTGMMVVAVIITGLIPRLYPDGSAARQTVVANIKAGFSYVRLNPLVRIMLIYSIVLALLSMPFRMLVPVFAEDLYGVDPSGVGIFATLIGVGGLAASLVSAGLRKGQRRGQVFLAAGIVSGISLVFIGALPFFLIGAIFAIGIGFGETIRWGLGQALIMEETDDEYRSRVMSLVMMSFGLMPAAVLPLGFAVREFGAQESVLGMSAILMVASLLFVVFAGRIRRLQ